MPFERLRPSRSIVTTWWVEGAEQQVAGQRRLARTGTSEKGQLALARRRHHVEDRLRRALGVTLAQTFELSRRVIVRVLFLFVQRAVLRQPLQEVSG